MRIYMMVMNKEYLKLRNLKDIDDNSYGEIK